MGVWGLSLRVEGLSLRVFLIKKSEGLGFKFEGLEFRMGVCGFWLLVRGCIANKLSGALIPAGSRSVNTTTPNPKPQDLSPKPQDLS